MTSFRWDDDTPVYVISVAAQLSGLHPQTLRQYDRLGIVSPGRTASGGRRYSARDIGALREVQRLSAEGVGLEGVRRILDLENQVSALQARVGELQEALDEAGAALRRAGHHLPVPRGHQPGTALVVWRPQRRSTKS